MVSCLLLLRWFPLLRPRQPHKLFRSKNRNTRLVEPALVVAYATASARQVRVHESPCHAHPGPTSPTEQVENVGDIWSEPWHIFRMECDSASQPIEERRASAFLGDD